MRAEAGASRGTGGIWKHVWKRAVASGGDNHCSEDVQRGLLRSAEGGVAQSYRGREGNDESGLRRDRADLLPLNERRGAQDPDLETSWIAV